MRYWAERSLYGRQAAYGSGDTDNAETGGRGQPHKTGGFYATWHARRSTRAARAAPKE